MKSGVELIAAERKRQIEAEGWTSDHDDSHTAGEMALAACCYAAPIAIYARDDYANEIRFSDPWPWDVKWDKRPYRGNVVSHPAYGERKRLDLLVKAGALIAAEIDRLQRLRPDATRTDSVCNDVEPLDSGGGNKACPTGPPSP